MKNKKISDEMITDVYRSFVRGKKYFYDLDLVEKTNAPYRFYAGDHWKGLKAGKDKMPIVEVIKPIIDYKVAMVTMNTLDIFFSPMNYDKPDLYKKGVDICEKINAEFKRMWENKSMDVVRNKIAKQACICGESYIYFYLKEAEEDKINGIKQNGEICYEIIDRTNIMFGDENLEDIEEQPRMKLLFRRQVKTVREEAKKNGCTEDDIARIVADDDTELSAGDDSSFEVEADADSGKCLCILELWKEKGVVYSVKCTKNVEYQTKTKIGLRGYPVAPFVWQNIKGSCRGDGEAWKYIPTQIWANRIESYRLISVRMAAFPHMVYDSSVIKNPEQLTTIGAAIKVDGFGVQAVTDAVGYINPAQMSSDAKEVLDELLTYTKEAANASDVARGQTQPDNYSAILAVSNANKAPLNEQEARLNKWVEDVARIHYDMWTNYYLNGLPVVTEQTVQDGDNNTIQEIQEIISNEDLKMLKMQIKVDVSPNTPYDKLAEQQKADNLLSSQQITLEEYTRIIRKDEPMKKQLEQIVIDRAIEQQLKQAMLFLQEENEQMRAQLGEYDKALNKVAMDGEEAKNQAFIAGQVEAAAQMKGEQDNGKNTISDL